MQNIELLSFTNGELGLPSVFKKPDGKPRFIIPLPGDQQFLQTDAGIAYLIRGESLDGGCEFQTRRFFDAHLQADDLFIDIGAHWGLFSLTAASSQPGQVSVLAIEAHPSNVDRLIKSVHCNNLQDCVEIISCAVADKTGTAQLIGGHGSMGHSMQRLRSGQTSVSVATLTLDTLLDERPHLNDKRVLLKIDVEGFEKQVIDGAKNLLAGGRLVAAVIEKGKYYSEGPGISKFRELIGLMADSGFSPHRFGGHNEPGPLIPYEETPDDCDIVFLCEGFVPLENYD